MRNLDKFENIDLNKLYIFENRYETSYFSMRHKHSTG